MYGFINFGDEDIFIFSGESRGFNEFFGSLCDVVVKGNSYSFRK